MKFTSITRFAALLLGVFFSVVLFAGTAGAGQVDPYATPGGPPPGPTTTTARDVDPNIKTPEGPSTPEKPEVPVATASTNKTQTGALALTGTETTTIIVIGVAFLGLGLALVTVARRRDTV